MAALPKIEHSPGFLKALEAAKARPGLITYSGTSVSQRINIMKYCRSKADVVRFVTDQLRHSELASPLIITIEPDRSEGCFVFFATGTSSDVTSIQKSLRPPVST